MASKDTSGYKIVYNPPVPFRSKLGTEFNVGRRLRVCGSVPDKAQSFDIELRNSRSGNVIFHFNPRFKANTIVTNSYYNGYWGDEEIPVKKLPFQHGDRFEILTSNNGDYFSVLCNGEKLLTFKHRQPVRDIDSVLIDGQVNLESVEY